MSNITHDRNLRRKRRVSSNIRGTAERPRITVHRSNVYIYAQAVDDVAQVTLAAFSSKKLGDKKVGTKSDAAKLVGIEVAKQLLAKNISSAVYDRGRFAYNGRVKLLAEGVREGGITV